QSQDPNDDDVYWRIRWPHKVTPYKGDLDNYIWRPHGRTPSFAYADLVIPKRPTAQLPSILLLFSTARLLKTFKQHFASGLILFSSLRVPMLELLHVIYAVFRLALSETREFLQDIKQQLFDMTLQSRIRPSKEKYLYLLHLDDCRKYTELDMTRNGGFLGEMTQRMRRLVTVNDGSKEACLLVELTKEIKDDLQYALGELGIIRDNIQELRKQSVQSFLGMNISQESAPSWLSSRSYDQPSNNSSSEDSSSPHVWDLRWFPILSAPLLFGTIILPLMTGQIVRSVCQTYVKLRIYWLVITLTLLAPATFVVYIMEREYYIIEIWDALLICVALSTIWNALRHPWHRSRRTLFGLLLLTLAVCDLVFVSSQFGLSGWIINFAGLRRTQHSMVEQRYSAKPDHLQRARIAKAHSWISDGPAMEFGKFSST
ncbi:MAG: hypothetical protein Q9204_004186, partial [Flavoplaca sp. TL-2023a]